MQEPYHLFILYFTVGRESGLALVAASDEKSAFQILKNSGSRNSARYSLIQGRDIGMSSACSFGLLMESYVNAWEAFTAIEQAMNKFVGPPGPEGPRGPKGEQGEKGDPGESGDGNIFVAEYEVTTWNEVNDAISSGKTVILSQGGSDPVNYLFAGKDHGDNFNFIAPGDTSMSYITLTTGDLWSGGSGPTFERTNNKAQTISTLTTNQTKYPTTKAVKDYVDGRMMIIAGSVQNNKFTPIITIDEHGEPEETEYQIWLRANSAFSNGILVFLAHQEVSGNTSTATKDLIVIERVSEDTWDVYELETVSGIIWEAPEAESDGPNPGPDEPGGDEPGGGEEPGGDEPGIEGPSTEEPGGDDPGGDDPPYAEDPGSDLPSPDDPAPDDPGNVEEA